MSSRTKIYDSIHKMIVVALMGGSIAGTYVIYSEISRLKKLKKQEIAEKQSQIQNSSI